MHGKLNLAGTTLAILLALSNISTSGAQTALPTDSGPPPQPAQVALAVTQFTSEIAHDESSPLQNISTQGSGLGQEFPEPAFDAVQSSSMQAISALKSPNGMTLQTSSPSQLDTTPGFNFDGDPGGLPPDPNGAAGSLQYIQYVNSQFSVYSRITGARVYGPFTINSLFSGFGGPCETNNNNYDGVVEYDKLADRWVLMEPITSSPYVLCIAVSTTADATGTWYRYSFSMPALPDFPKLGVWPDAYYVAINISGGLYCAYDRSAMIVGGTTRPAQCVSPNLAGFRWPADLDGLKPPPAGSPGLFVGLDGVTNQNLQTWRFFVNWSNPGLSSFTGPYAVAITDPPACSAGVSQPGTSNALFPPGATSRPAYRNFGDHESIAFSNPVGTTITQTPCITAQWYELRLNCSTEPCYQVPTIYQQGTYSPDNDSRLVPGIAMDRAGDIALGYSVSSSATYPSVRYTGRVPADPLGTMEGEVSIVQGAGSQTTSHRWGDFVSMSIDPLTDCTFWFTEEYCPNNSGAGTRIASFSFPSCAPPVFTSASDTYINEQSGNANYGSSTELLVGTLNNSNKGATGPYVDRVLIAFNVSLPSNANVVHAWLHLYKANQTPGSANTSVTLYRNSSAFDEATATWNNQPTVSTAPSPLTWALPLAPGWASLDVTSLASDCWTNENGQCSWQIRGTDEVDNVTNTATFDSKEFSPSTQAPFLEVGYALP